MEPWLCGYQGSRTFGTFRVLLNEDFDRLLAYQFSSPATGIPRVVTNYVNQGYLWAASNGIEVTAVISTFSASSPPARPRPFDPTRVPEALALPCGN